MPGVKSLFRAQKISNAILEEFAGDESYAIKTSKGGDGVYFFIAIDAAYTTKKLFSTLGVDVQNFEFTTAQEFFGELETPILISENYAIVSIEGVIEKVPTAYLSQTPTDNLNGFVLSNNGSFTTFGLNDKNAKKVESQADDSVASKVVAASLVALSLAWLVEGVVNLKRASGVGAKVAELREEYKLPQTTLEIDNVVSKAKSVEDKQNQIRKALKALNNLPLNEGESVEAIKISISEVAISIKTGREEQILASLKKQLGSVSSAKEGDKISFRVAIK